MPRGPAPSPNARRRNAPTIATRELPAKGRSGAAPKCPYVLKARGKRWWKWAWGLPHATAWDDGALFFAARRAQLEDDMQVLEDVGEIADALGLQDHEALQQLEWAFGRLKGIASGRGQVMKEMRELDNRLGLNPKAMVDLRWSIGETETKAASVETSSGGRRLRAVS